MSGSNIPLEIIFEIIEHVAIPPNSLSYNIGPSARSTLVAFSLVCRATYDFAIPLLYSRMCVESASKMRRLRRARPEHVAKIHSLFIDFEHLEDEVAKQRYEVTDDAFEPWNRKYMPFRVYSPRAALYYEMGDHLCWVINTARPSLKRLTFGSKGRPHPPWVQMDALEERAMEHFASQANHAIARVVGGLVELVCVRQNLEIGDYLAREEEGQGRRWENMKRLAVYGSLSYRSEAPPILPALESFYAVHPFPSIDLLNQALHTSPHLLALHLYDTVVPGMQPTATEIHANARIQHILEEFRKRDSFRFKGGVADTVLPVEARDGEERRRAWTAIIAALGKEGRLWEIDS